MGLAAVWNSTIRYGSLFSFSISTPIWFIIDGTFVLYFTYKGIWESKKDGSFHNYWAFANESKKTPKHTHIKGTITRVGKHWNETWQVISPGCTKSGLLGPWRPGTGKWMEQTMRKEKCTNQSKMKCYVLSCQIHQMWLFTAHAESYCMICTDRFLHQMLPTFKSNPQARLGFLVKIFTNVRCACTTNFDILFWIL